MATNVLSPARIHRDESKPQFYNSGTQPTDKATADVQSTPPTCQCKPPVQSKLFNAGVTLFVIFCGLPAMQLTGFGISILPKFTFQFGLIPSLIGRVIGGILVCPRPWVAGLVGGVTAGPCSFVAVYFYTSIRDHVWNTELVIVQMIAAIPGVIAGIWLAKIFRKKKPAA